MKEKIANALKTEYANLGLSKEALDGVASFLEKTVTDEEGIATAVKEGYVSGLLKTMQKESDRLRNDKSVAEKALAEYKASHPDTKPEPSTGANEEFQKMLDEQKAEIAKIQADLAESRKRESRLKMSNDVERIMKEKGAVNDYIRRNVLKSIEIGDEDTAETLAEKYQKVYDAELKEAFGDGYIPPRGGAHPDGYRKGDNDAFLETLRKNGQIPDKQ